MGGFKDGFGLAFGIGQRRARLRDQHRADADECDARHLVETELFAEQLPGKDGDGHIRQRQKRIGERQIDLGQHEHVAGHGDDKHHKAEEYPFQHQYYFRRQSLADRVLGLFGDVFNRGHLERLGTLSGEKGKDFQAHKEQRNNPHQQAFEVVFLQASRESY